MKISDELIQGFALGEAALSEHAEQVSTALAKGVDEVMMGTMFSMSEHDQFNREFEQALANAEDGATMLIRAYSGLRLGSFNSYAGSAIVFPANTAHEDFERMKVEIQAALNQAERRGEQKAFAFLAGWGIPPVLGILRSKDRKVDTVSLRVKERFQEIMDAHPELTRGQAYIQAIMDVGEKWIAGNDDDRQGN